MFLVFLICSFFYPLFLNQTAILLSQAFIYILVKILQYILNTYIHSIYMYYSLHLQVIVSHILVQDVLHCANPKFFGFHLVYDLLAIRN